MGDEADADWQDGLVEWGMEDGRPPVRLVRCARCRKDFYTSTIHICADKRRDVPADMLERIDAVRKRY